MNVINLLKQYSITNAKWNKLNALYNEYVEAHGKTMTVKSSSDIDGMPHGTVTIKKTENDAVILADKFRPFRQELELYNETKKKIVDIVLWLDDDVEFTIIWHWYIEKLTKQEIADKVCLSKSQVYRIHDRAISKLQKEFGDD